VASLLKRLLGLGHAHSRPAVRLPMGANQAAVLDVVEATGGALRPGEIHSRVELRLDQAVSRHTVASFLSVAARDATSPVMRSGSGRYKVQPARRPEAS
jgi:hypothetical protein